MKTGLLVLVQSIPLRHQVFFNFVVGNDWSIKHIPYQKKPKTLPVVLNRKEIKALLSVITNPKYHAIASTLYGAGLRISECLNLQIRDIDSENRIITVRDGKGRKHFFGNYETTTKNHRLNRLPICSPTAVIYTSLFPEYWDINL